MFFFFSTLYPVSKYFFVIQTIDRSKSYSPENKIVIDIPAGVTIFEDQLGILKHVKDVAKELADEWNAAFVDKPKVIFFKKSFNVDPRNLKKYL